MAYGVETWRLFLVFVLLIVASSWVFLQPDSLCRQPGVPGGEVAVQEDESTEAPDWSEAVCTAMRCHFPMLHFFGNPTFVPSAEPIPFLAEPISFLPEQISFVPRVYLTYKTYAFIMSGISYIIVPLWLGGIATRLVRQRAWIRK